MLEGQRILLGGKRKFQYGEYITAVQHLDLSPPVTIETEYIHAQDNAMI